MRKILSARRKVQGTRYVATAACVLILALINRLRKEDIPNIQQTAPVTSESSSNHKKFASVEVMQGDTLWSIAEENKTGNYTIKELVEEIKSANGLSGDKIIAGNYLIVPYYD